MQKQGEFRVRHASQADDLHTADVSDKNQYEARRDLEQNLST